MYSGGWAFSNSRKSVKYPPHDPHTSGSTKAPCFKAVLFGILQKPNKSQSSQKRTKAGLHAGIRPEPEPPASRRPFLPVFRPCLDPFCQSFIGRFFEGGEENRKQRSKIETWNI